jgi:hypothetical protein
VLGHVGSKVLHTGAVLLAWRVNGVNGVNGVLLPTDAARPLWKLQA